MRGFLLALATLLTLASREALTADENLHDSEPPWPTQPGPEALVVALSINGQAIEDAQVVYHFRGGDWWLPEILLTSSGITTADESQSIDGSAYRALHEGTGSQFRYDPATGHLAITLAPEDFRDRRISVARDPAPVMAAAVPAVFLDYDLGVRATPRELTGDGLVALGASNSRGVVSTLWNLSAASHPPMHLATTLSFDDPRRRTTLILGDGVVIGAPGLLPVQFAGIGWFSNFEIDPGFIPFPLPAMRAVTATASAIDIRVNHQPGYQARIDPGHFAIEDIPAPAGAGHLELITRDMFGNETRMIQPIYIAPRLLKRGLSAFAITLGAERAHYGERNFSYHAPFASAGLRHGLTEWLTLNTAAEVSQAVIDPVVGADLVLCTFASASLGLGGSWTDLQESTRATRTGLRSSTTTTAGSATGLAWFASVNRSTDRFSFGGGIRHASPHYRQIGAAGAHSLDTSYEVQVGASLLGGTLTASTAWMAYRNARDLRLATLSYTRRVLGRGQLSVGGSYIGGERARGELRAVVVMPLGERRNTSAGLALREDGQHATTFSMARSLPAGPGIGYDFSVATGDLLDARAGLRLRNQVLEADVDLVQRGAQTGAVARLRGGAVAIADHVFAARRVRDGLVLVETAGAEGVPVRLNNQDFGHSDRHGRALVPVQPFIPARITLDDSALPLSLRLDRSTTEITVERGRVGVTRFRAITSYSMTAILRLRDGQTPEPGALLKADGSPEPLPVGYDGVVFLSSEIPVRSYALTTVKGDCAFEVRFDETKAVDDETLPVLLCH